MNIIYEIDMATIEAAKANGIDIVAEITKAVLDEITMNGNAPEKDGFELTDE